MKSAIISSRHISKRCLVACNIYVSAGQARWAPFLCQLLEEAQQECTRLRRQQQSSSSSSSSSLPSLAVVHAYADGPYDRSSFHLAGSSTLVASLASHIAGRAASTLSSLRRKEQDDRNGETATLERAPASSTTGGSPTTHPTVGLVDHVSVLPLSSPEHQAGEESAFSSMLSLEEWIRAFEMDCPQRYSIPNDSLETIPTSASLPSGWAARTVGYALEQFGVEVLWYGHADPLQTPLADVRKQKTAFFRALPPALSSANNKSTIPSMMMGQATVGAPDSFVENYNIRVATHDKRKAQSLTKWVRSRDGGLPFLEALTLPYGATTTRNVPRSDTGADDEGGADDAAPPKTTTIPIPVYEVACNLLNPTVTSAQDIDARVQTWVDADNNRTAKTINDGNDDVFFEVLSSYRVGTTADMCLKALDATSTPEGEEKHNQRVREAFQGYLSDDP